MEIESKFPPKEFTEFYYHDIDGCGLPYCVPVNPVHTIYALKGSADAISEAADIVTKTWIGTGNKIPDYDGVTLGYLLGYYIIDIVTNNLIADQHYDEFCNIGVEEVLYFIHDKANKRLITNDRKKQLLSILDFPDYEPEIDDEDTLFPEHTELSLPTGEV